MVVDTSLNTIRRIGGKYDSRYYSTGKVDKMRVIKQVNDNYDRGKVYLVKLLKPKKSCNMYNSCRHNRVCMKYTGGRKVHTCYFTGYMYPLDPLERAIEHY